MKRKVLTDTEWAQVFRARCKSKRGGGLTAEEFALITAAHTSDRKRYVDMDEDVFNETLPVGSTAKYKGRKKAKE